MKTARALDHEAMLEFRQNVATLMPEAVRTLGRGTAGYPVRALASVVTKGAVDDSTRAIIAKTLFERGKKLFEDQKYADANKVFEQITTRYSYTSYVVEIVLPVGRRPLPSQRARARGHHHQPDGRTVPARRDDGFSP